MEDYILEKIAALVDKPEEIGTFTAKAEKATKALLKTYFDEETGNFFGNIQGANAYGLDIGLGDGRT